MNGKTLNPHKGHFDVYECTMCHKAHVPSVNGCAECHAMPGTKMKDK